MILEHARTRIDDACACLAEIALDSPRHRSNRCGAAAFDPAEVVVVEAWARVVPAVESFHLGQFEDGGSCMRLLVRDADAPATPATCLIWQETGWYLVKTIGPKSAQSRHGTLRSALEAVTSASPGQWRSLTLLAETILASRNAPGLARSAAEGLRAAA